MMSGLTEEQKQKIAANRQKALALRATKQQNPGNTNSAPLVVQQTPGSTFTKSSFYGNKPESTNNGVNRSNQTIFSGQEKPNVPVWLGVKPSEKVGNVVNTPSSSQTFYSSNTPNKAANVSKSGTFRSKPNLFGNASTSSGPKNFYGASSYSSKGTLSGVASKPVPGTATSQNVSISSPVKILGHNAIKGQCVLCSRDRFTVEVGYCAPLLTVFKTMPTRQFDTSTKNWSFDLKDYNSLLQATKELGTDVVLLEPLPRCVLTAFEAAFRGNLQPREIPEADLSSVDEQLASQLLPFQVEGVNFSVSRQGRVLIADDMGLGKTLQALAVAAYYRKDWPLLVVVPSSVRFAWREQILRWLPSVNPQDINVVISGKDNCTSGQINIVSYDLMVKLQKELQAKGFKVIIMDESHSLKNNKTARTQVAFPLLKRASRVILLSGTPALSRPSELFMQISAVDSRLFPRFKDFGVRYCAGKQMPWGWDFSGSSNLNELQCVLEEKIMIRRLKKDVLSQLPSKVRQMVVLDPGSVKIGKDMKVSHKYVDKAKGADRRGALLEYFCDTGKSKANAVKEYVLDLLESDHKFLVFAHHQVVLDSIEEAVKKKKYGYMRIDGRTPAEQRNVVCNRFQSNEDCRVAVLSITAANAGLNLTAASLVVFAELFWNPGILVQAEDRAHRIGQEDSVSIQYLVATGTADDFIWPLVQQKLDVLSKAGLSKENFTEADTKHYQDPKQKDILSYFEHSFFEDELPEELALQSAGGSTEEKSTQPATSGNMFQYFKPVSATQSKLSQADNKLESSEQKPHLKENNVCAGDGADWLDDDNFDELWEDEDPDAPWPKKPKLG